MVKFKGFRPATIWGGAAFHFLAVFSKKEILWKLWLWFSKMFHQRVFPDRKWSISKFQFWRKFLYIRDLSHQANRKPQTAVSRLQFHVAKISNFSKAFSSVQFSSFLFRQNLIWYMDIYRNCDVKGSPEETRLYEAWASQSQRNKQNKMKFAEWHVKNRN